MSKARILSHEERLAMTWRNSKLLQEVREGKNLPPPVSGSEEFNEKNLNDEKHCPYCGTELRHVGGCLECPNKCWSKCG
ncbi:MAG: hypothetical protein IJ697_06620 [Synergistaceae bacterium]|nr:hypothetical protein [Synergistaceae bacterium]